MFCVFRESEREFRNRGPKPVAHGVPGRCRYLEVLVLVVSFPYILAFVPSTLPLMGRYFGFDTLPG